MVVSEASQWDCFFQNYSKSCLAFGSHNIKLSLNDCIHQSCSCHILKNNQSSDLIEKKEIHNKIKEECLIVENNGVLRIFISCFTTRWRVCLHWLLMTFLSDQ